MVLSIRITHMCTLWNGIGAAARRTTRTIHQRTGWTDYCVWIFMGNLNVALYWKIKKQQKTNEKSSPFSWCVCDCVYFVFQALGHACHYGKENICLTFNYLYLLVAACISLHTQLLWVRVVSVCTALKLFKIPYYIWCLGTNESTALNLRQVREPTHTYTRGEERIWRKSNFFRSLSFSAFCFRRYTLVVSPFNPICNLLFENKWLTRRFTLYRVCSVQGAHPQLLEKLGVLCVGKYVLNAHTWHRITARKKLPIEWLRF